MAKDRARDDRRSVGSHEKIMSALGRATGTTNYDADGSRVIVSQPKTKKYSPKIIVPGQANIKVGTSHGDYGFSERGTGEEEITGTSGVSGRKDKRGKPVNLDISKDKNNMPLPDGPLDA